MKRFLRGFLFAGKGVIACIAGERNMRIHLCITFYVLLLMPFYGFTRGERLAVFADIGMVIAAECFNTAIEALTDLVCPDDNFLAGFTKDAAAGAVLSAALAAAGIGIPLYADFEIIGEIIEWLSGHAAAIIGLIVSAAAWVGFICAPLKKYDRLKHGDPK